MNAAPGDDDVADSVGLLRRGLPAWAISAVLHAMLMVVLGLTIQLSPPGSQAETSREVGVVIKEQGPSGEYFIDAETEQPADQPLQAESLAAAVPEQAEPLDFSADLPKAGDLAGLGPLEVGELTGVGQMTGGPRQLQTPTGGKARAQVYGVAGEGTKFVYVFDRSASMGSGNSPLSAAKAELLRSLESLGEMHQFQIIFYNERPVILDIRGNRQLVFGTAQNKELAAQFVGAIPAEGGTEHEAALDLALQLQPDVIFFLTDADQPRLSPSQMLRIRRRNAGRAAINTIEFGLGPDLGKENFLVQLARENGGQYGYVDVARFGLRR